MDIDIYLGGHGRLSNKNSCKMTYAYLNELKDRLEVAFDEDLDISEAVEKIKMSQYKKINMYRLLHKQNIETSYRVLEWENE